VFFIVFTITVLLQGQFKVETTTSFQPHFKVVSTLKPQPYFNQVSISNQSCINVETATLSQRWNHNVSTTFKYNHISTIFQSWYV